MASGAELLRQVKERISEVDPREVHDIVTNGYKAVVVDVREQHEWDEAHLPGAIHVPRSYLETRIENAVKDKDARVILYCQSGNRSAFAADTLARELGYSNVASMAGGITLWKDRGFEVDQPESLTPEQRERYSRHTLIPEIGVEGQLKLLNAKVLLLGAGGLGSPAALYLAAAGVGTLGLVDNDVVDMSNLQRQVAHSNDRIGMPKVDSAEIAIKEINPEVKVIIGAGEPLIGRLMLYDALHETTTELKVRRDPNCPVCSRDPESITDEEMGVFPDYEAFCAAV